MDKIIINNEWCKNVEIQVGKRYTVSDDFYYNISGEVVKISDKYIIVEEDETDYYDVLHIVLKDDVLGKEHVILLSDIDFIKELYMDYEFIV